ncbi:MULTISPECIES: ROK family transcriptional regulator [unclassified Streptomyces]|uniref:ROK family transcriptional regulator n=1 Tax=unclassified Streptomyces TaxID=2593676 RepID=UPI00088E0115|nr:MULTISPECIES: ROK family transcriptional regulator [unclassified Streptomyces]MDX2731755.1 ROK family transcriptional regulator [Streptomyces sp. PA03-2a]MDX3767258.1 ROK family transcriptional regulator [Streptomyces sp. AK08-01B]MDX3817246.1 ROK family transcriptional regulator [Streptomyces sp. AK08-01A]SCY99741.1 Sugar kinase of the NBD/HSP70 family, may contain an N-terminal HTH domain [Streptomyces sp. 136MFCol5.1]SFT05629.1 Sugar kinase of the NBD/HSP70 family, may contain an N-termi
MKSLSAAARRTTPLLRSDIPAVGPARRVPGTGSVLSAILDHGPVARSTVARLTGLSPASVTGHVGQLLARGLVRESAETAGPRGLGRPHIPVEIDTGRYLVAGAHIAVAHSTVSLMDLRGRIVAEERQPHRTTDPHRLLAGLAERIPRLVSARAAGRTVPALGVATGHRVDPLAGMIVEHPLLGWRDVPVRDILSAATGLPVHVDSHSRALARAEQMFGEASTRASMVLLFIGAVVDAAFATEGAMHRGPRSGAGSIAHLPLGAGGSGDAEPCSCGRSGCLQSEVSERAMVRRAAEQGLLVTSFRELLDQALAGEARAVALFRRRAGLVGRAAALLLDMFDPAVLVVVEPGAGRIPECLADLREQVAERSWVCDDPERAVVPSSFTGSVLATAGGAVALGALYLDPLGPWPALPAVS